jgi:glycosyltransferase involved in cell wall biosynthesis
MQPLVTILIPVFDDAASARMLLDGLAVEVARLPYRVAVLFVDDGSSADESSALPGPTATLPHVEVLRLRRNLGHQRAIAVGLAALAAGPRPDFVVVMDGDGEDDPATLAPLLEVAAGGDGQTAVFAARLKRQEGPAFVVGYRIFRLLHLLLVGVDVRIGNFSVLPAAVLDRVVGISEIWNHYAAGVVHARIPVRLVPTPRGRRLAGRSKMNLPALVLHGIGALSVWSDVIVARCFLVVALLLGATLAMLAGFVSLRGLAAWLAPAWALGLVGWLVVLLLLLGIVSLLLALFVLGSRNAMNVLPHRDWRDYVLPAR